MPSHWLCLSQWVTDRRTESPWQVTYGQALSPSCTGVASSRGVICAGGGAPGPGLFKPCVSFSTDRAYSRTIRLPHQNLREQPTELEKGQLLVRQVRVFDQHGASLQHRDDIPSHSSREGPGHRGPRGICSLSSSLGHTHGGHGASQALTTGRTQRGAAQETWETRQHKAEEARSVYPSLRRLRGDTVTLC